MKRTYMKVVLLVLLGAFVLLLESCMRMRISDTNAIETFKKQGLTLLLPTLKVGKRNLHYAKIGHDSLPTLFFVHGSPGSWDAFEAYLKDKDLRQKFRMIAIDRPGFGYSNFGNSMTLPAQCVLIAQIIQQERNKAPFHLVGHSIGGPVIVQLAQNHSENYSSLSILAGSISPFDEPKENWRYIFRYFPTRYLIPGAFRPSNDEILYFKKDLYELDKNYVSLTMPITFIHGDKDNFVTIKNVGYGEKKLSHNPNVHKIIIEGANHFIPWQHYEVIKKHLLTLKEKF